MRDIDTTGVDCADKPPPVLPNNQVVAGPQYTWCWYSPNKLVGCPCWPNIGSPKFWVAHCCGMGEWVRGMGVAHFPCCGIGEWLRAMGVAHFPCWGMPLGDWTLSVKDSVLVKESSRDSMLVAGCSGCCCCLGTETSVRGDFCSTTFPGTLDMGVADIWRVLPAMNSLVGGWETTSWTSVYRST